MWIEANRALESHENIGFYKIYLPKYVFKLLNVIIGLFFDYIIDYIPITLLIMLLVIRITLKS